MNKELIRTYKKEFDWWLDWVDGDCFEDNYEYSHCEPFIGQLPTKARE